MTFSRELKLGILAIIVIASMIWGYKFVIGQNLLKPSRTFYVDYPDVTGLAVSAPIKLNGFPIGVVTGIKLNRQDVSTMRVTLKVEDDEIKFPSDTRALLASEGIVGGKYVMLDFDQLCDDGIPCLEDGGVLIAGSQSLISSMVGDDEIANTVAQVSDGLKEVISSIGTEESKGAVNESFKNLEMITANLAELTNTTSNLLKRSQYSMESTLKNISEITGVLAEDRDKISGLLANMDSITASLAKADLGTTVTNSNQAIVETTDAIKEFKGTLKVTEETMTKLSNILTKVEKGEGSLAQLLTDEQLYTNLEFTSKNLALLLQDLRLNPRRYISVSVFGKDSEEYTKPEEDPAMEGEFEIRKIKNE